MTALHPAVASGRRAAQPTSACRRCAFIAFNRAVRRLLLFQISNDDLTLRTTVLPWALSSSPPTQSYRWPTFHRLFTQITAAATILQVARVHRRAVHNWQVARVAAERELTTDMLGTQRKCDACHARTLHGRLIICLELDTCRLAICWAQSKPQPGKLPTSLRALSAPTKFPNVSSLV